MKSVPLAVSGLNASSEMISEDRGDTMPEMRSSASCGMTIRSRAVSAPLRPVETSLMSWAGPPRTRLRSSAAPRGLHRPMRQRSTATGVSLDPLHPGEDMRPDRTIGMQDRDLALQDRLKTPPDVKTLGLAADEHGYRLKIERHLACCLNCRDACGFCRDRGVTHGATASSFGCSSALAAAHCACNSAILATALPWPLQPAPLIRRRSQN